MKDRFVWVVEQIKNQSPQTAAANILQYLDRQIDAYESVANAAREFVRLDFEMCNLSDGATPMDKARLWGYRDRAIAELTQRIQAIPEHS